MDNNLNNKHKRSPSLSSERLVGLVQVEIREVLAFAAAGAGGARCGRAGGAGAVGARGVGAVAAAMARRAGLGLSEMAALEHLQQAGEDGLTPTQLGRRLSLRPGAGTARGGRVARAG